MNFKELRPGQRQALNVILGRLAEKERFTTIVLPTRYGKSDLMRLAAIAGEEQEVVGWSLVLSPVSYLRGQFVDEDKVRAFIRRYDIDRDYARRCFEWDSTYKAQDLFADPRRLILSATMAMATRNIELCVDLAEEVRHRTGRQLLVQIDECHEVSAQKRRGEFVQAITDHGGLVVLYTATPIRADNELIPGFQIERLDDRTRERYERSGQIDAESGRELLNVYGQSQSLRRLRAHHETTYRQAWDEEPAPICRLTRDVIDVDVLICHEDREADKKKISDCTMTEARRVLGRAIRTPEVIAKGAELVVRELAVRRIARPTASAIVFTGNDQPNDEEDDRHAKAIKKAIVAEAKRKKIALDVRIVTMNSEEGDDAADLIGDFVRGNGDILIVKQMGGAGLDCERLKVVLDLSSVRTVASIMQRVMRAATPWGDCKVASIITLADPMMKAIWEQFIVAEGGEAKSEGWETWVTDDEWFSRQQLKKDEDPDPRMVVGGAGIGLFDDSDGGTGHLSQLGGVNKFLEMFPEVGDRLTKPEIAIRLERGGWVSSSSAPETEIDCRPASAVCDQYRTKLSDIAKSAAKRSGIAYFQGDAEEWIAFQRQFYGAIKQRCGVAPSVSVSRITDPDLLLRMIVAAQEIAG